jgi:hypothetical protein
MLTSLETNKLYTLNINLFKFCKRIWFSFLYCIFCLIEVHQFFVLKRDSVIKKEEGTMVDNKRNVVDYIS